jgi:hypothetical protein
MLAQEMVVLSNVLVVEIGNAKVKQDVEQETEVEQSIVKSVITGQHRILNCSVNPQYPEGLYEEVQQQQQRKIGYELFLHGGAKMINSALKPLFLNWIFGDNQHFNVK